jgi:hypothetical protein
MKSLVMLTGLMLALAAAPGVAAARGVPTGGVVVTLDQSRINTEVGEVLTVVTEVVNSGDVPTDRLVAHLNVASLDSGVYVDLEDWSKEVTRELAALPAGRGTSLSWQFHAVNAGTFDVYIVLLPDGASSAGSGPLVVSPPVHVTVAERRALTAGGSLPVAVVVPILLGLVAGATRYRIRRSG